MIVSYAYPITPSKSVAVMVSWKTFGTFELTESTLELTETMPVEESIVIPASPELVAKP